MSRRLDRHIDADELDAIVARRSVASEQLDELPDLALEEARLHVASCSDCSERLRIHQSVQNEIDHACVNGSSRLTAQCASENEWLEVAAGIIPGERANELLKHAARCGHCGALLRDAITFVSEPASRDEEEILATLNSAQSSWQRDLATNLQKSMRREPENTRLQTQYSLRRPTFAAAVLVIAAAASWMVFRSIRTPSAEQLLAQAYSEHRNIETRFSGAKHAPMRSERGYGESNVDRPQALLSAETLIGENLRKRPDDPKWLQAKAEADLLDGNYDSAIRSLQHALEAEPEDPAIQTDLASAFFLEGTSESRPQDFASAIDLLGKVLQRRPEDHIALFNRAIIAERMHLLWQAERDWEQYLKLDPSGEWHQEAVERLKKVKAASDVQRNSSHSLLLKPAELAQQVDEARESTWALADGRIEEYQALTARDWLETAFPPTSLDRVPATARDARKAVRTIAIIARERHKDRWLDELLSYPYSPEFSVAVRALAKSIRASDQADYELALTEARAAHLHFLHLHNAAGLSRARFEEVFALHFSNNTPACALLAASVGKDAVLHHFSWIALQAQIERGICENANGNYGEAKRILASASENAHVLGLPLTAIRALTMGAAVAWSEGNSTQAWSDLQSTLTFCSVGQCPRMSLYSIYANMDEFAEDSHQWYLQVLVAKQALISLGDDQDHLVRAVEHSRLSKAAVLANLTIMAARELTTANQLLASAPQTEVTRNYRAGIQIDMAKLATEQRQLTGAGVLLNEVRSQVPRIADHYLLSQFYQTLGHLQLNERDLKGAVDSLKWSLAFAEEASASLDSAKERLEWRRLNEITYRDLVELDLTSGDQAAALNTWEWFLGVPLRSRKKGASDGKQTIATPFVTTEPSGTSAPKLPEMSETTRTLSALHTSTLISYVNLSGRIGVWVSDDRGIFFTWLKVSTKDLLVRVRRFDRLCSDRNADPSTVIALSRDLYRMLLGSIEARLAPGRVLLFDGDSDLVDIPFQALTDESGASVSDKYSVSILPSARYMEGFKDAHRISSSDLILVLASPLGSRGATRISTPLPDVLQEANEVMNKFHSGRLLTGGRFQQRRLAEELKRATVFHFAGHAIGDKYHSALMIETTNDQDLKEEVLDASRLVSLVTNHIQLAVLSACSTETENGMEDPNGMALSFLDAGVPHVVASRWNVDSATTVRFMDSFYNSLLAGRSVPQSVREAGNYIRSQRETQNPYYWAAFSSFGTP